MKFESIQGTLEERGLSVLWPKPMTGGFEVILLNENLGYWTLMSNNITSDTISYFA